MLRRYRQHQDGEWTNTLSDNIGHRAQTTDLFKLFNEIAIIHQLASVRFESRLPHNLTVAQFGVLNHFVRLGDGKTPARLAAAFQVTKGTMTSTLKRLEDKAFVNILPSPEDGRAKHVYITEEGRKARDASILAFSPVLQHIDQALTAEELQMLLPVLSKLRGWLDEHR